MHSWGKNEEKCSCGQQRCKGHGRRTGFRCNKPAEKDGYCGSHQGQKYQLASKLTASILQKKAGGQDFWVVQKGKDASDAYRKACDAAEAEYGHQEGYSGQINSTHRMYMITPPKGIQPKDYAQMCMEYRQEYDWKKNQPGAYPKAIGVTRQVEQKPGTKCQVCKKGTLSIKTEDKSYTPAPTRNPFGGTKIWPEQKWIETKLVCSTPGCTPYHSTSGKDQDKKYFTTVKRNIDTRRFPTLERDARLAQEKGNACCIALNSRTFLFFGIAPS